MSTDVIGTTGTRDWSSIQAWWDAIPSTLIEAEVGQVKNEELTGSASYLLGTVKTTTASLDITLEAVAGGSFKDHADVRTNALRYNSSNGASLYHATKEILGLNITQNNMTVRNLQFKSDSTNNYDAAIYLSSGSNWLIDSCIIESNVPSSVRPQLELGSTTGVVRNCLVVANNTNGFGIYSNASSQGMALYHCTVVRPSNITAASEGFWQNYFGLPFYNCAFFGFSVDVHDRGVQQDGDNNADNNATPLTDAASGFPDNSSDNNQYSVAYTTATFVEPSDASSATDFRAVASGALDGNGVYNATHGAVDITGTTRDGTSPTIGCWEIAAAPSGPSIPLLMHDHRSRRA